MIQKIRTLAEISGDSTDEFVDAIKFFIIKYQRSKNIYRVKKYYEAKYEYGRLSCLKNILEKKSRIKWCFREESVNANEYTSGKTY